MYSYKYKIVRIPAKYSTMESHQGINDYRQLDEVMSEVSFIKQQ